MLIFLDLETTGLEQEDVICALAIIADDGEKIVCKKELVNEGKKIPPQASSIHHISNEMIQGKKSLVESEIFAFLQKHNTPNTILVGHNIGFDLEFLSKKGFDFLGKHIDTMRVAKHLIKECESYALQFLRYELKLYKEEKKNLFTCEKLQAIIPHEPLSDAFLVYLLYHYLLENSSEEKMVELSLQYVLLEKFDFGKYKGHYIEEIAMNDRGYLEWMVGQIDDLDEDLRYSINYYLEGGV